MLGNQRARHVPHPKHTLFPPPRSGWRWIAAEPMAKPRDGGGLRPLNPRHLLAQLRRSPRRRGPQAALVPDPVPAFAGMSGKKESSKFKPNRPAPAAPATPAALSADTCEGRYPAHQKNWTPAFAGVCDQRKENPKPPPLHRPARHRNPTARARPGPFSWPCPCPCRAGVYLFRPSSDNRRYPGKGRN